MSVPNKAETSYKAQSRTQFRDVMGININDYINTLRVNEFRRLLNDKDVSLEEAVERAGFQSMRTAYRCYKAVYGSTPRSK